MVLYFPIDCQLTWLSTSIDTNLTVKLYPSDEGDECQASASGGLSFTTRDVPSDDFVCIDIEQMFRPDRYYGSDNDTSRSGNSSDFEHYEKCDDRYCADPPGIDFHILDDSGDYDSGKNWSNLWFKQINESMYGGPQEGEDGRFIINTYANKGCIRVNSTEEPWYKSSCQTGNGGQCESTPYSIRSIEVRYFLEHDFGDCQTWAKIGAASGLTTRAPAALVVVLAFFLLL